VLWSQGLAGSLEKQSAILGRNAVWARHSKISRLPKYLCIQLMRFYWKPTPESREHAGVKCKMMRVSGVSELFLPLRCAPVLRVCVQPVAFPADGLDMFEFCTPELQAALRIARDKCVCCQLCAIHVVFILFRSELRGPSLRQRQPVAAVKPWLTTTI
jgi:hypothetical protein